MSITRDILKFINRDLELNIDTDTVREFENNLNCDNDFNIEIDGNEYRVIHSDAIWGIYVDEIQMVAEDCYNLEMPDWIAVDWEKTAENCYVDGYGHHFSHYDHSEEECTFGEEDYYIFRIG